MKKIVITGGPGCGKSSVLVELGHRGYLVMPETFRWLKVLSAIESFDRPAQEEQARSHGQDFISSLLAFQRFVEDEETRDEFCFYDLCMANSNSRGPRHLEESIAM